MPSPETHIVQNTSRAIEYTGTNSADIIAQAPDVTFVSEAQGFLTIDHFGTQMVLAIGYWLRWGPWSMEALTVNQYTVEWECFTPCGDGLAMSAQIEALTARVEALENPSPLLR